MIWNAKRRGSALLATVVALTILAGCTARPPEQKPTAEPKPAPADNTQASAPVDWAQKYPTIKKDIPGPFSYDAISKKKYSGITLNVIAPPVPVMGEPAVLHAKQFAELTGARVNVVHVPFGDLFAKIMLPFQTGQQAYDVLIYPSLWIGDFAPYLEPLPQRVLDSDQMKDTLDHYREIATWNGKMVQFPVDGDRHYLKYRSDILNDPKLKDEYRQKSGKELKVPQTWEEFGEIAAFLNNRDRSGTPVFGAAEVTARDNLLFSAFISRAAPYARHPKVTGGFFFDLKTMKPLINSPGFVKGLEDMVAARKYWPPGGENWGLADEIFSFGGGQTVFSYTWDDAFIQAQEKDSKIRNKVGAAMLPGARKVWNRNTNQWDEFPDINYAPYVAWGWSSAVAAKSPNKDAAFDFLGFFSNPANHSSDLLVGRFGVNPFRKSDMDVKFWSAEAGWDEQVAREYVETLNAGATHSNRTYDLLIPGAQQYMVALATGVSQAFAGQQTPQQALDGVAKQWDEITRQIGVDKQREAYARIVAFEDQRHK